MHRVWGITIVAVWLAAMSLLVGRDVLPYWRAQDPPRGFARDSEQQVGVFNAQDRRVGTCWTSLRRQGGLATWQSTMQLEHGAITVPGFAAIPAVIMDSTLTFQDDGALISFETNVHGLPAKLEIKGNLLGIDYACSARFGSFVEQSFTLDARLSKQLGEMMRPFNQVGSLKVGQCWQLRVINPLSLFINQAPEMKPLLVRVTGKDRIQHRGEWVDCFKIESDNAWAYADAEGKVLVQVVNWPLIGKFTLRDEKFDAPARAAVRARTAVDRIRAGPSPHDASRPANRTDDPP